MTLIVGFFSTAVARQTPKLAVDLCFAPGVHNSEREGPWTWDRFEADWRGEVEDWKLTLNLVTQAQPLTEGAMRPLWRGEVSAQRTLDSKGYIVGIRVFRGKPLFGTNDLLKVVDSQRYREDGTGVVAYGKKAPIRVTGLVAGPVANLGDDGTLYLIEAAFVQGDYEFLLDGFTLGSPTVQRAPISDLPYVTYTRQSLVSVQAGYHPCEIPLEVRGEVVGALTERQTKSTCYRGAGGAAGLQVAYAPRSRKADAGGAVLAAASTPGFRSVLGDSLTAEGSTKLSGYGYWRPTGNLRLKGNFSFDGPQRQLGCEALYRFPSGNLLVAVEPEQLELSARVWSTEGRGRPLAASLRYRWPANYWRCRLEGLANAALSWTLDYAWDDTLRRVGFSITVDRLSLALIHKWSASGGAGVGFARLECLLKTGSISVSYGYDDKGRITAGWHSSPKFELGYRLRV